VGSSAPTTDRGTGFEEMIYLPAFFSLLILREMDRKIYSDTGTPGSSSES